MFWRGLPAGIITPWVLPEALGCARISAGVVVHPVLVEGGEPAVGGRDLVAAPAVGVQDGPVGHAEEERADLGVGAVRALVDVAVQGGAVEDRGEDLAVGPGAGVAVLVAA